MSEPPKKKVRFTNALNALINYMATHMELALGTFTSPMGQQASNLEWQRLAAELAEVGPAKTVEQWKTTWRDIKVKAKASNALVQRQLRQTGNKENIPSLSTADELVLGVIGRTTSEGLKDVPESVVTEPDLPDPEPSTSQARTPLRQPTPPLQSLSGTPPLRPPATPTLPPTTPAPTQPQPQRRSRSVLGQIYEACSASATSVLTDIANHLKERNDIERERNAILREKNNILYMILGQRGDPTLEILEETD